jgi:hypothetical protein
MAPASRSTINSRSPQETADPNTSRKNSAATKNQLCPTITAAAAPRANKHVKTKLISQTRATPNLIEKCSSPQQGAFSRGPGPLHSSAGRGTGCPCRPVNPAHGWLGTRVTFAGCGVRATCGLGTSACETPAPLPPVRRRGFDSCGPDVAPRSPMRQPGTPATPHRGAGTDDQRAPSPHRLLSSS